ncbi:unnamed protein product [Linum tenue]|uniref:Uncharacterized protein n=1 Tax=Linum tenue TaxID=586396 RepID=A0AAV0L0K0_9ROSI|nr:unnamed protein product [Linum tenue]
MREVGPRLTPAGGPRPNADVGPKVSVHLIPRPCSHGDSLAVAATQKQEAIESREAEEDGGG